VARSDKPKVGKHAPSNPISNFPVYDYQGGAPDDPTTLEVFSLRRRNAELNDKVRALNNKLTRCHELLNSLKRFFDLWIYEDQGETYDELQNRMRRIKTTIELIEDRMVGETTPLEMPERWRKKE